MSEKKQKSTAHGKAKPRAKATSRKPRAVAENKAAELREITHVITSDVRDLATLREDCADYIRTHPMKAVTLAACAGFVLGIAVRK